MTIEFKDPPPTTTRAKDGAKWQEAAAALRARPGEWALIAKATHPSTAVAIKTARLASFRPAGAFDASVRKEDCESGKVNVYARYVGEVQA